MTPNATPEIGHARAATTAPQSAVRPTDDAATTPWQRRWSVIRPIASRSAQIAAAVIGSLPVLWVLGAVPWRTPTLVIEHMFSGFVACAHDGGALNPIVMLCERAGVPMGMYQLDAGLSYPLGGVLVGFGIEPLTAWKLAVAALVIVGFLAMFWLARRLTDSPVAAAVVVTIFGLSGPLTARSWNWYWNVVAAVLLPTVFAAAYALFDHARGHRIQRALIALVVLFGCVLALALEWQYAGMFGMTIAVVALVVVVVQRALRARDRLVLALVGAAGIGGIFLALRSRMNLAGVITQFDYVREYAANNSVDVAALFAPDPRGSLTGLLMQSLGFGDILVGTLAEGRQLWIMPYSGVLLLLVVVGLTVRWWRSPRRKASPPGYLTLLTVVAVMSAVLSLGPELHVAGVAAPDAYAGSPLASLWSSTPLQWIRYPFTWAHLTHLTLLLLVAALITSLRRPDRSWSPLVIAVAGIAVMEIVSPVTIATFNAPTPVAPMQGAWASYSSEHPDIARFEATAIPELHAALADAEGPSLLLPWDNTYTVPYLGPAVGIPLRNVGIDRNVIRVEAAAPFTREELRRPKVDWIEAALDRGWAAKVVLLDHPPTAGAIVGDPRGVVTEDEVRWHKRVARLERRLDRRGYCVRHHSWFSVVTWCAPGPERRTRTAPAVMAGPR